MRIHYHQHVAFEGLGSIAAWLTARGVEIKGTRFDEAADLPDLADVDWLIVLGGPMSANDEHLYAWLSDEKAFIGEAIRAGKRVLGICLGAQLIASALGAKVYPNAAKEIGWFPIASVPGAQGHPAFRFPPDTLAFHWHGETFDLPVGSVHLARSGACENQAFQIGNRVIGLQFHLETTPESARALVAHCREELRPATYVQSDRVSVGTRRALPRSKRTYERGASVFGRGGELMSRRTEPGAAHRCRRWMAMCWAPVAKHFRVPNRSQGPASRPFQSRNTSMSIPSG